MPGPMTVAGNLVFQSGALYLAQITPSSASIANVTGAAGLAGTVAVLFFSESFTRRYSGLSAAGGFNGSAFSALATTNLPAGFAPALSYTATDVVVNVTAVLGQGAGLSQNQQNAAGALNNFFNKRRHAAGRFRLHLQAHWLQSRQRALAGLRRSRDRRAAGRLPDGEPVPQPHARSVR